MLQGIFFGASVTTAVYLLWKKTPGIIKRLAVRHYLLSDIILTILIYLTIGTASTATILGSTLAWVATSVMLSVEHKRITS